RHLLMDHRDHRQTRPPPARLPARRHRHELHRRIPHRRAVEKLRGIVTAHTPRPPRPLTLRRRTRTARARLPHPAYLLVCALLDVPQKRLPANLTVFKTIEGAAIAAPLKFEST